MDLDVLCMMAHPDDAEILCGGTLIKLKDQGYAVGIIDFTRGEMSTRGDIEQRNREAALLSHMTGITVTRIIPIPRCW